MDKSGGGMFGNSRNNVSHQGCGGIQNLEEETVEWESRTLVPR